MYKFSFFSCNPWFDFPYYISSVIQFCFFLVYLINIQVHSPKQVPIPAIKEINYNWYRNLFARVYIPWQGRLAEMQIKFQPLIPISDSNTYISDEIVG